MAEEAKPASSFPSSITAMPRQLQIALAVVAAAVGVGGLALAAWAWTAPTEVVANTLTQSDRRMEFSYSAEVPANLGHDGTTVTSPDPVFRNLTNMVDVRLAYKGDPGWISVAAELSSPSGWHSTVPLAPLADISGRDYTSTVALDLNALDARAQDAAAVTGLPSDPLTVAVVSTVQTADGRSPFESRLTLSLAPLEMSLGGDSTDSTPVSDWSLIPNTIDVYPFKIGIIPARALSLLLLVGAMIAAALVVVSARRTSPLNAGAIFRRRYAALLASVEPIVTPTNVPIIDVTEFSTLVKLAERCGQLVLHWRCSAIETFVIVDQGTTYRYRAGSGDDVEAVDTATFTDPTQKDLSEFDPS